MKGEGRITEGSADYADCDWGFTLCDSVTFSHQRGCYERRRHPDVVDMADALVPACVGLKPRRLNLPLATRRRCGAGRMSILLLVSAAAYVFVVDFYVKLVFTS